MDKQTQEKLLQTVKQNYDDIATDFDTTRQKPNWPEMVNLTAQIKDGDNILDVGCGNGRLLNLFKDKNVKYLGVDSSEKLIEIAKTNFKIPISSFQSSPNIKFQNLNILELNKIEENNFDHIYCIAVLHHLPGQDLQIEALKQMKDKLSDNGRIIITAWNLWKNKKCFKLIWKFWLLKLIGKNDMNFGDILFPWKNSQGENISERFYHAFTKRGLKKIAKKAGLKVEELYKGESPGMFFAASNYYLMLKK